MIHPIRQNVAQQIVETVKDVCDHDINFIDSDGIIFASTNPARLETYHEIGKKVIACRQTIEVETDNSFPGTQRGVNIPFIYNGETIAAIGITGDPKKVRKYAYLAQKITNMILREHELDIQNHNRRAQKNYMIHSLISGERLNRDYLEEYLKDYEMTAETICRTIVVKLNSRYNLSNLSLIENQIKQTFKQAYSMLYTFHYPNEYVLIMEEKKWNDWSYMFQILAQNYEEILKIGIGASYPLLRQNLSYDSARLAISSLYGKKNIAAFEDLDLEILLGSIQPEAKKHFMEMVLKKLTDKEKELLHIYFASDMSLKETCEKMFIHKNTIQYQLDKIWQISHYNPRSFQDAVILYLALKMDILDRSAMHYENDLQKKSSV